MRVDRPRIHNTATELVAARIEVSKGRISAERRFPVDPAAGYARSPRNFGRPRSRKALWRRDDHRRCRPAVWALSEHLVIDWATVGAGLHLLRDGRSWKPNLAVAADGPWPQLSAGLAVWAPKYVGAESIKALGGDGQARVDGVTRVEMQRACARSKSAKPAVGSPRKALTGRRSAVRLRPFRSPAPPAPLSKIRVFR